MLVVKLKKGGEVIAYSKNNTVGVFKLNDIDSENRKCSITFEAFGKKKNYEAFKDDTIKTGFLSIFDINFSLLRVTPNLLKVGITSEDGIRVYRKECLEK